MAQVQVLYWFDIPAQVRVREGRARTSQLLPARFQEAIDSAAMVAGITGDEAYTGGFHWKDLGEREGDAAAIAAAVVAELDASNAVIDWRRTAETIKSR